MFRPPDHREARAKIAAECGYDLGRLAERSRKVEAEYAERIRSPKKEHSQPSRTVPGRE